MSASVVTQSGSKTTRFGTQNFSFPNITNNATPESKLVQAFTANTFTAVAVPSGANGAWISVSNPNGGTITLKGVTGDTGLQVLANDGAVYWLPAIGGQNIGFLCSTAITLGFEWT